MIKTIKFYREDSNWYAFLPDLNHTKEECQMVAGADTMLDILAQGDDEIYLKFGDEPFDGAECINLIHETPDYADGGGEYLITSLKGFDLDFQIWLCNVTKSVFNTDKMPLKIYIR